MPMTMNGRGEHAPTDNDFVALARQMDHDLRSPLTTICSYAECIASLPSLEPEARELYARTIVAEARRLGRLASSFVALATPPVSYGLDELDLADVLDGALKELRDAIDLRGLQVDWEKPAAGSRGMRVLWPRVVLKELLVAAIEAVVGAGGVDAHLQLRARDEGDQEVAIEVSGPRCERSHVAENFTFRAAEALARQRGGTLTLATGAGLCLSLRLPRVGCVCEAPAQDRLAVPA